MANPILDLPMRIHGARCSSWRVVYEGSNFVETGQRPDGAGSCHVAFHGC